MTATRRKFPSVAAGLGAMALFAGVLICAAAETPGLVEVEGARTNAGPPLPPAKSPVDSFRTLLEMPADEQQKLLVTRPPEIRQRILEKIKEYRSLTTEERELRLQATELRWYLTPLLSLPATNRAAQLARIPQPTRDLVEARLKHWTVLPPPLRQVLLTNQQAMSFLTGGVATNTTPTPADALRHRIQQTVERFFELTQKEKERTLGSFSETERLQMEKTLAAFEQLTPAQRARCVRSFTKFATLSVEERQEFLQNAERWSQMSPPEREAWRDLVSRAPILPPLPQPPPRRPLLPVQSALPVGTNGQ
jgi:hypothetical protein